MKLKVLTCVYSKNTAKRSPVKNTNIRKTLQ